MAVVFWKKEIKNWRGKIEDVNPTWRLVAFWWVWSSMESPLEMTGEWLVESDGRKRRLIRRGAVVVVGPGIFLGFQFSGLKFENWKRKGKTGGEIKVGWWGNEEVTRVQREEWMTSSDMDKSLSLPFPLPLPLLSDYLYPILLLLPPPPTMRTENVGTYRYTWRWGSGCNLYEKNKLSIPSHCV